MRYKLTTGTSGGIAEALAAEKRIVAFSINNLKESHFVKSHYFSRFNFT